MSDKPWFQEGLRRYAAGEKLNFSTDISGDPSWGYGTLDDHGFFRFPVPFDSLRQEHKDLIRDLLKTSKHEG